MNDLLKGIGKQVVVIKKTDSEMIEEAIFIIKDNITYSKPDILSECKKIIRESNNTTLIRKNKYKYIRIIFYSVLSIILIALALIFLL